MMMMMMMMTVTVRLSITCHACKYPLHLLSSKVIWKTRIEHKTQQYSILHGGDNHLKIVRCALLMGHCISYRDSIIQRNCNA